MGTIAPSHYKYHENDTHWHLPSHLKACIKFVLVSVGTDRTPMEFMHMLCCLCEMQVVQGLGSDGVIGVIPEALAPREVRDACWK